MKLSEKLAALEEEESREAAEAAPPPPPPAGVQKRTPRARVAPARRPAGTPPRRRCASWSSTRWPRACRASRPRSSPSR